MSRPQQAIVVKPDEGTAMWVLHDRMVFKVTGELTNGLYAFCEQQVAPQSGPPPHVHYTEDEAFYVLEGEVTFFAEDSAIRATKGTFVHVPQGTVHTFKNEGSAPARMLVLITPAGFEQYFSEIGHAAGSEETTPPLVTPATYEKLMAAAPQYNLEFKLPTQAG